MAKQKDIAFPFGIYIRKLVCDIPNDYLEWIRGEKWFKDKFQELKEQIDIELDYRKKFDIIIKNEDIK